MLVWSGYNAGEGVNNTNFVCCFVPKAAVAAFPGLGHSMITYRGSQLIQKYVYIYDDRIVGNSTNDSSSATSEEHTVDKRQTCLRMVLGV